MATTLSRYPMDNKLELNHLRSRPPHALGTHYLEAERALCGLLVCCSPVSIKTLCGSLLSKYEPQNILCPISEHQKTSSPSAIFRRAGKPNNVDCRPFPGMSTRKIPDLCNVLSLPMGSSHFIQIFNLQASRFAQSKQKIPIHPAPGIFLFSGPGSVVSILEFQHRKKSPIPSITYRGDRILSGLAITFMKSPYIASACSSQCRYQILQSSVYPADPSALYFRHPP